MHGRVYVDGLDRFGPEEVGTVPKVTNKLSTVPTVDQFKQLMSVATTSTSMATSTVLSPTPVVPCKHGEVALGPDGEIDFSRRPRKPPGLPEDMEMRVYVEKGCWVVQYVDRN